MVLNATCGQTITPVFVISCERFVLDPCLQFCLFVWSQILQTASIIGVNC